MDYHFSNIFMEKKDLLSQKGYDINSFLLENNKDQLEKLYDFYNGDDKLLYLNGFLGTGKADIVNYSVSFLNNDVIVLKFNCFNSTILDDMLLGFFKEFRELIQNGIITAPKIKTDNFNEKINAYFSNIQQPFLIILDSFEAILDENRQEILDFIFHLLSMDKTKVIIIGRSFNDKLFEGQNVCRITTHALDKKLFEKFIKSEKVKVSSKDIETLYSHTRGYYYYTILTIRILQANNISLETFLNKLKNTFIPYTKLLEKEVLALIPQTSMQLFWFLILIRQDVSVNLLKKLKLYNEEDIKMLINNSIVTKEANNLYIQDYFEEITKEAPQNLILRLRQFLVDIYQSQLPLKPLERDICISRQTMRKEIEYHKLFLPKKLTSADSKNDDINILTYSKAFEHPQQVQAPQNQIGKTTEPQKQNTKLSGIDLSQRKNVSLNLGNFSISETKETNAPALQPKTYQKEEHVSNKKESLSDYITLIKKAEKLYQYSEVLELAQKALTFKNDLKYKDVLPFIYARIANAYNKTAQHDKALSYYKLLEQIYKDNNEILIQIRIKIANILYETYKFDAAKEIYLQIVNDQTADESLILKSYLKLINIAEEKGEASKNLTEYFNNSIELAQKISEHTTLAEIYFKYALLLDDRDEIENAKEYYKKSTETDNTTNNKYLSSAYSNLASLAMEEYDTDKAIAYYKESLNADENINNNEGIYDSASRLADILKNSNTTEALNYYKIAFAAAKATKEAFYIIASAIALGDYYFNSAKNENALKYYDYAYSFAQDKTSKENLERIKIRLKDIKFRIGEKNYENLIEMLHKQNDENE